MTSREREMGLFGPLASTNQCGKNATVAQQGLVSPDDAVLVRIAFEKGGDRLYDYALADDIRAKVKPGQRVRAPFGPRNRQQEGFCVALPARTSVTQLKTISEIIDASPLLSGEMMELAQWTARYYCCPLGSVLSAMVPAAVKKQIGMISRTYIRLTELGRLYSSKQKQSPRLSSKGQAIISFLQNHTNSNDETVRLDRLTQQLHCTKSPFQTLRREGLIELFSRRELAQPPQAAGTSSQGKHFELNEDQIEVLRETEKIIDEGTFQALLLHGVTGSGKTEVYIRAIEKVIEQGKQALLLVPEIALTPQTVDRFLSRFLHVAVLHSGLSQRQRHQQWRWIAQGGADVVVGARSAVFAPLKRLGLIVVDEEHEPGYKQDKQPRYHGRDVAIKRAQLKNITIILGSATPSLETLHNSRTRKHFHLLKLPRRVLDLPMPKVTIVDMRLEASQHRKDQLLSRILEAELTKCLNAERQAILLLNRRGYSNFVYCPSCRHILTCPNCDVSLTYHRTQRDFASQQRNWIMCHYCLHSSRVPRLCPLCSRKMILIGPGTQKAVEELQRKIPHARVQRADSDSIKPGEYDKILSDFGAGHIDILLGTQMIGKGLDFPNVALVGVLNADTSLFFPDFRSSERTFQLIAQVAGRCGRACDSGRVIVQTFLPDEPAVEMACRHDYDNFARHELTIRRHCQMPPFQRQARIILRDSKLEKTETAARQLRGNIDHLCAEMNLPLQLRGPVPAVIARVENYHRWEILIQSGSAEHIQVLLTVLRQKYLPALAVQAVVDVDPISLM